MNVAAIKNKAYRLTNTNSTTFLSGVAADILEELNIQYGHRTLDILKVQVDRNASQTEATATLMSTSGLVAGDNGYNGEYAFPTDLLKPIRVEVSYDGETWYLASVYDIFDNEKSEHEQDDVQANFSQSEPFVRFDRDSFFIRPLKTTAGNITAGIHIWYEQRQTDLTSDSPAFEANLHDILAYDLANQEYLMHKKKYDADWKIQFDMERSKVEQRFLEFYKNRFKRNGIFNINYSSSNLSYS